MKYIRTKDGRIIEESKLEPGFKEYIITLRNKKDNKVIDTLRMDYVADKKKLNLIEDIAFANYCKAHKLDARDINRDKELKCNNVIATADTIEDLCDRFVIVFTHSDNELCYRDDFKTLEEALHFISSYKDRCKIITLYGAIWTDKGLIYVAKMNDKGELYLL